MPAATTKQPPITETIFGVSGVFASSSASRQASG